MTANQLKTVTIATILVVVTTATGLLTACGGEREPDTRARPGSRPGVDLMARVDDYTARFRPGSGYQEPTRRDRDTVARGVRLLLDGDRAGARRTLADIDFVVRTLTDSASGRHYTEVADRSDDGPAPRGWGRFYLAQDTTPPNDRWTVQVPHPVADRNTERLGVGVLRGAPGGVMVLAGAHRAAGHGDAADVAHRKDTVFDAVCATLAERGLPAVQVHGFTGSSAPGHDSVVSTGRGTVARPEGRLLADALRDRGFPVCRAWSASCPLEGRTNVQGRKAAEEHVAFLHIEFSNRIRTDEQRTATAVAALGRVTNLWQKGERP